MFYVRAADIVAAHKGGYYMEGMCEACIGCRESWSAASDESCHEYCDKFKEWQEKREAVVSESKNHS